MAEEVANVARRVNATVEEGKDTLGKNLDKNLYFPDPKPFKTHRRSL